MKKNLFLLLTLVAIFAACSTKTLKPSLGAVDSIARAIEVHGGKHYAEAAYSFVFRNRNYTLRHQDGRYEYSVRREKDDQKIYDVLTNEGFSRTVGGVRQELSDKDALRFGNSLNSVIYFALLPYKLNDSAVRKIDKRDTTIKGKSYKTIEVRFTEEGGGTDHEDVFYYWINKEEGTVDYLAYLFHVNGGGVRFRSAYNSRNVNGIRFQDYVNYKAPKDTPLASLPQLFEADKLKELSRIELENIQALPISSSSF